MRSLPFNQAVVMALAGVAGLYAGIAAGLFANVISLTRALLFHPAGLASALGASRPEFRSALSTGLARAPWHPEFVAIAVTLFGASRLLARLAARKYLKLPDFVQPRRIRAIGWLVGFGLVLYYPMLLLTTFNAALRAVEGQALDEILSAPLAWRVAAPALGGLVAGLVVRWVSPESAGHGVVEVMEALNVPGRTLRARIAVWKSVVAGVVLGSGGSAGREGPIVQIGASIASGLTRLFGLPHQDSMLLIACGGAAGIAASFNTPIGGTLFALEILLGEFRLKSIAPIAFAAVTATLTGRALIAPGGEIERVTFTAVRSAEIVPYLVLGGLAALVAVLYVRSIHLVERAFADGPLARVRPELRPMLGGLAVGLVGLAVPRVLGTGYDTMNATLAGELSAVTLVGILGAKILASGFTLGSGAPGGSFFPAVFLGSMLGGAFGLVADATFPNLISSPADYAAVGMAAVVAGATQAPLTGIMMLVEITGSFEIILPLMLACTTSVAVVNWALGGSMYTLKLRRRGVTTRSDERRDALRDTTVGEAMTPGVVTIPAGATFDEVIAQLREQAHAAYPVVDRDGHLRGLLMLEDVRALLGSEDAASLVAADLCIRLPARVTPGDSLETALARMGADRASHLAVVRSADSDELVGIISIYDVVRAVPGGLRA